MTAESNSERIKRLSKTFKRYGYVNVKTGKMILYDIISGFRRATRVDKPNGSH